jgi:hypothetical protein
MDWIPEHLGNLAQEKKEREKQEKEEYRQERLKEEEVGRQSPRPGSRGENDKGMDGQ